MKSTYSTNWSYYPSYANTKYITCFSDGAQKEGVTDEEGQFEVFLSNIKDKVKVELLLSFQSE